MLPQVSSCGSNLGQSEHSAVLAIKRPLRGLAGRDREGMGLHQGQDSCLGSASTVLMPGGESGRGSYTLLALPSLWDPGSTFPSVRDSPEVLHSLLIASWWIRAVEGVGSTSGACWVRSDSSE